MTNEVNSVNRDFKGIWIPREIWLAQNLGCQEKCLWAEIHSLFDREKGGCYASNEYLMNFFGVKERRLQEMIANLKHTGWLIQVSFDGRTRLLKAIIPPEDFKPPERPKSQITDNQPSNVGAEQRCIKVHPGGAEKCTPGMQNTAPLSEYIYTTTDTTIYPPLIPPPFEVQISQDAAPSEPLPAKAGGEKISIFFTTPVKETVQKMVEILKTERPKWNIPKSLNHWYSSVQEMMEIDGRTQQEILSVMKWALSDDFWRANLFKGNTAKYLRKEFDRFDEKMRVKSKNKDFRKFAPCSNSSVAKAELDKWSESAL